MSGESELAESANASSLMVRYRFSAVDDFLARGNLAPPEGFHFAIRTSANSAVSLLRLSSDQQFRCFCRLAGLRYCRCALISSAGAGRSLDGNLTLSRRLHI
jgi:hypothetical protein